MFCGLPTTVSALPTLAPIARAMRYGTGRTPSGARVASRTGVSIRQTVSLTNSAESAALPITTDTISCRRVRTRGSTQPAAHSKKPPSSR